MPGCSWAERLWPGQPALPGLLKMVCKTATRGARTLGASAWHCPARLPRDNQDLALGPVPGTGLDPPSLGAFGARLHPTTLASLPNKQSRPGRWQRHGSRRCEPARSRVPAILRRTALLRLSPEGQGLSLTPESPSPPGSLSGRGCRTATRCGEGLSPSGSATCGPMDVSRGPKTGRLATRQAPGPCRQVSGDWQA